MQNFKIIKEKSLIPTFVILFMSLTSCKPVIHYLGNSYPPTTDVTIFFDEYDIKREYTVMGKMENQGESWERDDAERVQAAMIEKAKSVGADAILFNDIYEKVLSEDHETSVNKTENTKTINSSNSVNTSKIYMAKLIKYKD